MQLDQALPTFIAESRELLEDMENALLVAEQAEDKTEIVNAVFRAAHTIKGSAGLFGLDDIVAFTHVAESVLDRVRGGQLIIAGELVSLLLSCCDHINALINGVEAGQLEMDEGLRPQGAQLAEALSVYLAAPVEEPDEEPARAQDNSGASASDAGMWHLSLRFDREVLRNGMDPLSFIRYLGTLGEIVGILSLHDALPPEAEMDPECNYLGYEIAFRSSADQASIEGVFDFVTDYCQLRILPPQSPPRVYRDMMQRLPAHADRLRHMLVGCGTIGAGDLSFADERPATSTDVGVAAASKCPAQPETADPSALRQRPGKEHVQESRSIRVDADKLDQLINLVGELIIAGASASLVARRARASDLQEAMSKVSSLVEDVRDSALQLRMVKIGATFNRFQRIVHDVSRDLGKEIALVIDGEDTELDKTVIEKIGDPLTHLVRNAMDHGIEPAEVRLASGKPARGTVSLNAYHDSGSIVIAVSDDGGGLKRDRILAKAIERGLVEPSQHLEDDEIYKLIFEPDFSTADQVSNLSGRGVGMDVVKRNITALRGTVGVQTTEGTGTTITVRLPLTLAIIDGFLVEVGKSVFAIPLDMIEECVAYSAEPGHDYTNLRGQVLPFVRLRELFNAEGEPPRRENIVVLKHAGKKAGLVVDRLLGEFQTVIKPLGKMFSGVRCISGSTILGSGEVALILDVPALVQQAGRSEAGTSNLAA
ncbi:MAG TPA: chemotaxis protein CheA [Noviherbaspirillum sp.]|nr:chemotaxis protein CheA [Noviherbaspirillum sp.]